MDVISNRYHLLLLAIEASVLKALQSNISHKKIQEGQMQASILGSQLGIAQLENALPDEQEISRGHYAPLPPIQFQLQSDRDKNITAASTVARTAIVEAYRQAAIAVYSANNVDGWIWEVEGDDPCDWCLNMDGTIHPITEEFKSHDNCRCGTRPSIP